jgi:MFS family permease
MARGDRRGALALMRTNGRFRQLAVGLLVSRIGDASTGIAIAWFALSAAGPTQFGLVLLCFGLPRVPLSPFAGHLLDRYPVRRLLIVDNIGRGALVMVLAGLGFAGHLGMAELYPIALLCGALSPLTDVGENVFLRAVVDEKELDAASTVLSLTWETSTLVGPALAGLLVCYGSYGPAFTVDALSFVAMAFAATALGRGCGVTANRVPEDPKSPDSPGSRMSRFLVGFTAMARVPGLLALTAVSLVFLFLTGTLEVILPAYVKLALHGSVSGLGLLGTIGGLGAVIGALVITPRLAHLPPRVSLALVLALQGLLFLPFLVIRTLAPALALDFVVFSIAVVFYPLERALSQRLVPEKNQGRIFGARRAITAGGYPLGNALGGSAAVLLGSARALAAVGIGMCLLALAIAGVSSLSRPAPEPAEAAEPGAPSGQTVPELANVTES